MGKRSKVWLLGAAALWFVALVVVYLRHSNFAVLNPEGPIAARERHLMIFASLLSLIVIVPVFAMTFYIVWQYRESNQHAKYRPDWDRNPLLETIWWGVPTILIMILSVVTWQSSHQLDPFKPLAASTPPLTIQVVALQWKWLFIYPEQHVASVNYLDLPVGRPLNFEITSDGPMNSFWIPQLGGQIYAMSGMSTQLHLMAARAGSYSGVSANISGAGFAGMKFTAQASSPADYERWLGSVKQSSTALDSNAYRQLSRPSSNQPVGYYSMVEPDLYNKIVMQYMMPGAQLSLAAGDHND